MEKGKHRRLYRRVGVILLIAVFAVFIAFRLAQESAASLSTLRTQEITERTYASLNGYIFRNEEILYTDGSAVVDYHVSDGEKLPVGRQYVTVYPYTDANGTGTGLLQASLDALNDRLRMLSNGQTGATGLAGIRESTKAAEDAYRRILTGIERGNYTTVEKYRAQMLAQLSRRQALTGQISGGQTDSDRIAALRAQKDEILRGLGAGTPLVNELSAWFYRETDGYERIFTADAALQMPLSELGGLLFRSPEERSVAGRTTLGKRTVSAEWYLVMPASAELLARYEEGDVIEVEYGDEDGVRIPMTVERLLSPEADGTEGMFVLNTNTAPEGFTFSRSQSVRFITESVSGYRIPDSALVTVNEETDEMGVYVLSGSTVEFRTVRILRRCEGYCIAESYEDAIERNPGLTGRYLQKNDLMITAGTNLYVGKIYY